MTSEDMLHDLYNHIKCAQDETPLNNLLVHSELNKALILWSKLLINEINKE